MSYRTVLTLVDTAPPCDARLAVAATLAANHGARLIGLHLMPKLAMPAFDRVDQFAAALEQARSNRHSAAVLAESMYRAAAGGLRDIAWEIEDADEMIDVETRACRRARCVDLTIAGQVAADQPLERAPSALTERLVMEAGGPVLVVPYSGRFPAVGKRILVAWNQSREAARAMADALPLLRQAEQAWLLTIDEKGGTAIEAGDRRAANGIAQLAAHGVTAKPLHDIAGELTAADIILSRVSDLGADLLVLGAYGHSRMRELALGGVTRDILRHMTVPTLMSH